MKRLLKKDCTPKVFMSSGVQPLLVGGGSAEDEFQDGGAGGEASEVDAGGDACG